MKKLICLLLFSALLLSACSKNAQNTTPTDTNVSDESSSNDIGVLKGYTLQEIFDEMKSSDENEYPSLASTIIEDERFEYYFGIQKPGEALEALAVEPIIGAIPFSVCLLRVEGGTDIAKLAQEIESSVDPRKWVCVEASYVKVSTRENVILLVMDDDDARGKALTDRFLAI